MAEDDKYVPSEGNPFLDPTRRESRNEWFRTPMEQRIADAQKELSGLESQRIKRESIRLEAQMLYELGYEKDEEGIARNIGYKSTKGYAAKEKTKAARAHITERTWGKDSRGETLDMYGKKQGGGSQMQMPKVAPPKKKSDITASMAPEYGVPKSKFFNGSAAGSVASGLMPWIGRFNPTVCGPVRVSMCGFYGGVIQSNVQEAANNGFPIKIDNTWGTA